MQKLTQDVQITKLKALVATDSSAGRLARWLSERERDATETTVERLMSAIGVDRATAIGLMQKLTEIGVGDFYVGRRGAKTRIIWSYSCKSIGEAALMEATDLELPGEVPLEVVADEGSMAAKGPIDRAKELIAHEWGINPANIEIIIKA